MGNLRPGNANPNGGFFQIQQRQNICAMLTPSIYVAFVAAIALAQVEKTAFSITLGNFRSARLEPRMAETRIQLGKQRCILWSMGEEQPSSENDSFTRVSGDQPLPGGKRAKWVCKAKPGLKFTETMIGSKTYNRADGRVFLLSGKEREVRVLQLDMDPFKLGTREMFRLAKEDPKVREFFQE
jgi:hypothetical protein